MQEVNGFLGLESVKSFATVEEMNILSRIIGT